MGRIAYSWVLAVCFWAVTAGVGMAQPTTSFPNANTPLTGSEYVGIVQNGKNVKTTVGGLTFNSGVFTSPISIQPLTTTATDPPNLNSIRTTTHTGGSPGFVESNLRIVTTVGAGVTDFEWTGLSIMNNFAAAGENVAFYNQANKHSTGPTWAEVNECNDFNNAASSIAGSLPCTEIDINSSGLDDFGTVGLRGGIDMIPGRAAGASGTSEIGWGARVNVGANAVVRRGFYVAGAFNQAAFDASLGTAGSRGGVAAAAFRGTGGQLWDFAGDSSYYLILNGTTLQWQHSGATLFSLDNSGTLGLAGGLTVSGPFITRSYTVAALPSCTSFSGAIASVTDAVSPIYNGALTGGGTVHVPVFCDGTVWTSH